MKILWKLFWSFQNWTIFRGHFYAFTGLFLRSRYRIRDIFLGLLNFQILFGGAWNSWYFLGWRVDAGPEPTYEEKMRVSPLGHNYDYHDHHYHHDHHHHDNHQHDDDNYYYFFFFLFILYFKMLIHLAWKPFYHMTIWTQNIKKPQTKQTIYIYTNSKYKQCTLFKLLILSKIRNN